MPVSTGGGQVLYAGTYLPSDGNPEKVGAGVVAENPELFGPHAVENLRLEQILARLGEASYPELEPDQALSRLGKEQLRSDVVHHPAEYVEFLATKVGRIWSHGPRAVMREPVWEALHWVLLGLGLFGLGLLAYLRRWEALLIGAVFLAITLISALLVASPRRVLVLIPLPQPARAAAVAWLAAPRTGRGDLSPVVGDRELQADFGGRVGTAEEAVVADHLRFDGAFSARQHGRRAAEAFEDLRLLDPQREHLVGDLLDDLAFGEFHLRLEATFLPVTDDRDLLADHVFRGRVAGGVDDAFGRHRRRGADRGEQQAGEGAREGE